MTHTIIPIIPATDLLPATATEHVADLTDEEILGIDGPGSEQVAPLPWLGRRSEADVELAAEVGLRGLVAHGRIAAHEDGLELPDQLDAALALRHNAQAIVYADHSTRLTQETRVVYVHADAVLVEEVNGAGVHRFSRGDLDTALAELAAWSIPQHETADDGRIEGDGLPPELDGLQSVVFLDVVTLTGSGDVGTAALTFYRLRDGQVVEGVETPDRLDLPPRSDIDVRRRVEQTVRGALAHV
ncbi:hypothetical protein [Mobilicoccus massiliensis]|uniref:hypothetical protein n=1 Tax=Mobilicoccus massiliensis TaxID=1522310 RepID=UPI00058F3F0E|nr:hypothetical protein [Mobilicoccus massiliensis]